MYEGLKETWEEWGRSLDLKDAASPGELWGQLWLLTMVQGLPLILSLILFRLCQMDTTGLFVKGLLGLNISLILIRFAMLLAISGSYDRRDDNSSAKFFWLSPFADPFAVARIFISASRKPTTWRGRTY